MHADHGLEYMYSAIAVKSCILERRQCLLPLNLALADEGKVEPLDIENLGVLPESRLCPLVILYLHSVLEAVYGDFGDVLGRLVFTISVYLECTARH